jgi:type IV fimbrial biogenesis protein FimT
MRRLTPQQRGYSLIESLVALTISAILIGAGMPAFADYLRNSKLREAGNTLLADALYAQSEAIKRNDTLSLVATDSSVSIRDSGGTTVRQRSQPDGVSVSASVTVTLNSFGRPAADASINLRMASATCSADIRCPGLRLDAGGGIRLCGDNTSCN